MEERDTKYVFRDEIEEQPHYNAAEEDVVIVDGEAMSYRSYRR